MSLYDRVLVEEDRSAVRTLYVFDFDDTLVYSPPVDRLKELTKASSIAGKPIKAKPQVRGAYQRAKQDHNGKVIVMTGRINTPELRKAVKSALDQAGYPGHKLGRDLFLKNPNMRSTAEWKKKMLRGFMRRFPNVRAVHMWDDRGEHIEQFRQQIRDLEREPHVVHVSEGLHSRVVGGGRGLTIKFPVPGRGRVTITRPSLRSSAKGRKLKLKVQALMTLRHRAETPDPDEWEEWGEKLGREGQREPITIGWSGGRPEIEDGHHRLFGADDLGWKKMDVYVRPTITDETLKKLGLL